MCSRTKEPHRVTYSIWHVSLVQWKGLRDQGTAETLGSTFMFILRCADLGMCVILGLSRVLACIDNDMKVTQINIKGKHKKRQLQRNRISTRKVQSGYIADQQRTTKVEMVEHVAKKENNDTRPGYLSRHTEMHKTTLLAVIEMAKRVLCLLISLDLFENK
jgi:hypothetical protein